MYMIMYRQTVCCELFNTFLLKLDNTRKSLATEALQYLWSLPQKLYLLNPTLLFHIFPSYGLVGFRDAAAQRSLH